MKFLTPIVIVACAIALFFWYIQPTFTDAQQLQAENVQAQANLTEAQAAVSKTNDLVNRYNSLSNDQINQVATALPATIDPLQVVVELNSLASKYGTTIHDIQVVKSPVSVQSSAQNYVTTQLTFGVSFTYQNFISFLGDIEHDLRITDVSSVSFSPSTSDIYNYTMTVNVYSLK